MYKTEEGYEIKKSASDTNLYCVYDTNKSEIFYIRRHITGNCQSGAFSYFRGVQSIDLENFKKVMLLFLTTICMKLQYIIDIKKTDYPTFEKIKGLGTTLTDSEYINNTGREMVLILFKFDLEKLKED